MRKSTEIADYFIRRGRVDGRCFSAHKMTHIVYLASAWYYAIFSEALVDDEVRAWRYCPVLPKLYYKIKHIGHNDMISTIHKKHISFTTSEKVVLNKIYDIYKDWAGEKLSALISCKGSPWDKHKSSKTDVIEWETIRKYYLKTVRSAGMTEEEKRWLDKMLAKRRRRRDLGEVIEDLMFLFCSVAVVVLIILLVVNMWFIHVKGV